MNLWLLPNPTRSALLETNQPVAATSISLRYQCQLGGGPRRNQSRRFFGKFIWRLGFTRIPAALLILAAFTPFARGESSVTLAWDASASSSVAGYRFYEGITSRTYTNVIAVGKATTATASNLVSGATYFFAVTAVGTNGLESDYSSEVSYLVPLPSNSPPLIALTAPANRATYTAPATIKLTASVTSNGHTINQVQFFNGTTLLGAATVAPYSFSWPNVGAGTYSLIAKLVYDSGSSLGSAAATVTVAAATPQSGLTFAADSGTFSAPFVDSNGTLTQTLTTGVTNGGQAVYTFNIPKAGNYLISAMIIAPSLSQNSLYVNIDAEPTDPLMIWDIPVCLTLTSQTVSWRGNGSGDPASSQYVPKVFSLAGGTHQLIIRGREPNTTLGAITIAAKQPRLRIRTATGLTSNLGGIVPSPQMSIILSVEGDPAQTFNVLGSQDLVSWAVIGTVTLDATGSGEFTDPASSSRPRGFYRLQDISLASPTLQIRASAGGPVVLSGSGPAGRAYVVQRTEDLKVWTVIGTVTLDVSGSFTFTDTAGSSRPRCLYRLKQQ